MGETAANYAALRRQLTSELTCEHHIDLFVIQETNSKRPRDYLDRFNGNNDQYSVPYDIVFPFIQDNKPAEVALIYNTLRLQLVANLNVHDIVHRLCTSPQPNGPFTSLFPIHGPRRIIAAHFKVLSPQDKDNYTSSSSLLDTDLLFVNLHSIHRGVTDESKERFIIDFFRFTGELARLHQMPVVVGGDFNLDICTKDIPEQCHDRFNIRVEVCQTPSIEDYFTDLQGDHIPSTLMAH
eukprot:gene17929-21387_t